MQLLLDALTYYRGSDEPLSVVVILLVRVTLVVATGWLAGRAVAQYSAAVEHRVWLLVVLATLIVPTLWALTPGWRLPLLAVHVEGTRPAGLSALPVTAESAWPELLVAVWITGTVAGLAYMALGVVLARRLFARSRACRDAAWAEALAAAQRITGVSRRVELRMAPCSMSPAVWGFRRVRILVPAESLAWPLALRRSVLVHELAHVARRDCTTQLIAGVACAVWWFHPLVWFAAARMRGLAEQAADDCVIRAGQRRTDYAEVLLAVASSLGWNRLPAAIQTMLHPSHLERRLRAILDPTRRRNPLGGRVSVASVLVAGVLMVLLATVSPSVVRAVPPAGLKVTQPAEFDPRWTVTGAQPAASELDREARMAALVEQIQMKERLNERAAPSYVQVELLPYDARVLAPPQLPAPPPQATTQLIPNWDTSQHAEMLIPNYLAGTAQTLLVDPVSTESTTGPPRVVAPPTGDAAHPPTQVAAIR